MSNDKYQHQTFCQKINKMKKPKIKIDVTVFPGILLGFALPKKNDFYAHIIILCFSINIKTKKR